MEQIFATVRPHFENQRAREVLSNSKYDPSPLSLPFIYPSKYCYNIELEQQKMVYQKLYKEKDEKFNKAYLQLAADKEKITMSRDKYITSPSLPPSLSLSLPSPPLLTLSSPPSLSLSSPPSFFPFFLLALI